MGKVGGHQFMTNTDTGTLLFIKEKFGVTTMSDVGCGTGGMVLAAIYHGIYPIGIDGDPMVHPTVLHNFDDGPLNIPETDLGWSVEFLEHMEEKYLDNVFSVFEKCKYVFCTHNEHPGPWHFNCRDNSYWIDQFARRGFRYDPETTGGIKNHSTMLREFVKDTGQFFINDHRGDHGSQKEEDNGNSGICL